MSTRLVALLCFILALPSLVNASVVLRLDAVGGDGQGTFMPGDTVTIRLSAVDGPGAGPNFATDDLRGFQVALQSLGAAATTVDSAVGTETFGPGFNFVAPLAGLYSTGNRRLAANPFPFLLNPTTTSYQLVEFSFLAGAADVGVTTIGFNSPTGDFDNTITFGNGPINGYTLAGGQLSVSPVSITVTAIPEPGHCALFAIGAIGLYLRQRRRNAVELA